jgi:hypothetical protein
MKIGDEKIGGIVGKKEDKEVRRLGEEDRS